MFCLDLNIAKRWKGPGLGRGGNVRNSAACMVYFTHVIDGPIEGHSCYKP